MSPLDKQSRLELLKNQLYHKITEKWSCWVIINIDMISGILFHALKLVLSGYTLHLAFILNQITMVKAVVKLKTFCMHLPYWEIL